VTAGLIFGKFISRFVYQPEFFCVIIRYLGHKPGEPEQVIFPLDESI
jgi:hypothetical protein